MKNDHAASEVNLSWLGEKVEILDVIIILVIWK